MRYATKFGFVMVSALLASGCGDFNPWSAQETETVDDGGGDVSEGEAGDDGEPPPPFTVFIADNYDYDHPDVPAACMTNDVEASGFGYLDAFDHFGFEIDYRYDPYSLAAPEDISKHVHWAENELVPYGQDENAADAAWIAVYSGHGNSNAVAMNTIHADSADPGVCHLDAHDEIYLGDGIARVAVWDASCVGWHAGPDMDFHSLPQDMDGFAIYGYDALLPFTCSIDGATNSHFAFFDSPWTTPDMAEAFLYRQEGMMSAEHSWMYMYYEPTLNVVNQPIVYMWGTDKFDAWDRITYGNMLTGDRLTEPYAWVGAQEDPALLIAQLGRDGSNLLYGQFSPYTDAQATDCEEYAPIWMPDCTPWE